MDKHEAQVSVASLKAQYDEQIRVLNAAGRRYRQADTATAAADLAAAQHRLREIMADLAARDALPGPDGEDSEDEEEVERPSRGSGSATPMVGGDDVDDIEGVRFEPPSSYTDTSDSDDDRALGATVGPAPDADPDVVVDRLREDGFFFSHVIGEGSFGRVTAYVADGWEVTVYNDAGAPVRIHHVDDGSFTLVHYERADQQVAEWRWRGYLCFPAKYDHGLGAMVYRFARDGRAVKRQAFNAEAKRELEVLETGLPELVRLHRHHVSDVHIKRAGRDVRCLFLVLDLLEGTVQDWLHLHAEATVASVEALALVERIAFVVKALHDCGFIHRDLKPANLGMRRLSDPASAVIIDVGSCDFAGDRPAGSSLSGCTLVYAAPEVLMYQAHRGVVSDAFAVGLVAAEILTGGMFLPPVPTRTMDFGTVRRHRDEWQAKQLDWRDGYCADDPIDVACARELLWLRLHFMDLEHGGSKPYAALRTALLRRGLKACRPFVARLRDLLAVDPTKRGNLAHFAEGVKYAIAAMRAQP